MLDLHLKNLTHYLKSLLPEIMLRMDYQITELLIYISW
jgi:hypothetical protein